MITSKNIKYVSSNVPAVGQTSETVSKELDEQVVWQRFLNGDEESVVYLYRKYVHALYRYGYQFTNRKEFLRDSIQDLFYELIDKRKKLSVARSVKGYLFSSFKRKLIRGIKKEEKLQLEDQAFSLILRNQRTFMNVNLDQKDYSLVQKKLNNLPVNQREVILLYFYEGLSYSEIAEIMGIKIRSARSLTYRAIDSLQSQLAPHEEYLMNS